ncbi:hypothetical protein PYH37_004409 [Sinorhizobium numidicum]|uniref:Uncharacterized protein n=1 Tax=Sinorhizobium numidicum TaxID=680248 RepID=A0ABY8CZU4_9HYPH|nr:hypothetical protein [Sinorhizobium numidicum]WEX76136.1 hypothetical protein PYH37_004409 [Sinorhizobium numidicum]WEX82795.1 hypothetical protein PYH38_005121 [Sinorhizobium numidicum]
MTNLIGTSGDDTLRGILEKDRLWGRPATMISAAEKAATCSMPAPATIS